MTDTTIDRVKNVASHLQDMDASVIDMYIEDAKLELQDYNFDDSYMEKLQRYLAAHLATLNERRPDSYSVDDISVSYTAQKGTGFESTEYGQEFLRLMNKAKKFYLKIL